MPKNIEENENSKKSLKKINIDLNEQSTLKEIYLDKYEIEKLENENKNELLELENQKIVDIRKNLDPNIFEYDKWTYRKINKYNKTKQKGSVKTLLENSENIIEIRNLVKFYTSDKKTLKVLDNISLNIKRGDFLVLFGKSGSGKSTLLNIISGLDRVTSGKVVIENKDIAKMTERQSTMFRRKNMSFIFQRYNLLPNLTAYENVETGSYLQKNKKKRINIAELFKMMDIDSIMHKYPSELSGGQMQRVSIARAITKNPSILFADEPTGALDDKMTILVLRILKDINKKYGTTIVMVSHNPLISKIADKVIKIKEGLIDEILTNLNPSEPEDVIEYD